MDTLYVVIAALVATFATGIIFGWMMRGFAETAKSDSVEGHDIRHDALPYPPSSPTKGEILAATQGVNGITVDQDGEHTPARHRWGNAGAKAHHAD